MVDFASSGARDAANKRVAGVARAIAVPSGEGATTPGIIMTRLAHEVAEALGKRR